MQPEILSAWLQVGGALAVGILLFFLGRWSEYRYRSKRQVVETIVTYSELLTPNKTSPISISLNEEFATGKPSEMRNLFPIMRAYNYLIWVSNVGLEEVEKPEIDILLSEKASIIEFKVNSDKISADKIEIQEDTKRPNYRRVIPKYMNTKNNLTISVLSINDT